MLSNTNSNCGYDVDSVFVAVTLPPAGQIPKQQSDHFKQEIVSHSQEHQREESQGIETRVVRAFFFRYFKYFIIYYFMAPHVLVAHKHFVVLWFYHFLK